MIGRLVLAFALLSGQAHAQCQCPLIAMQDLNECSSNLRFPSNASDKREIDVIFRGFVESDNCTGDIIISGDGADKLGTSLIPRPGCLLRYPPFGTQIKLAVYRRGSERWSLACRSRF